MESDEIEVEWDEAKRAGNLAKHGIDFQDAIAIWRVPVLTRASDHSREERFVSIGQLGNLIVAVVWTQRADRRHIILARRAGFGERKDYAAFLERGRARSH